MKIWQGQRIVYLFQVSNPVSHGFGFESQFHGQEGMVLGHGGFGAVDDIVIQGRSVGQGDILAVDILGFIFVYQEKMVGPRLASDIEYQLNGLIFQDFAQCFDARDLWEIDSKLGGQIIFGGEEGYGLSAGVQHAIGHIVNMAMVETGDGIMAVRQATGYVAVRDDLVNAGAEFLDVPAVKDGNILTGRVPDDLPEFCGEIIDALAD